MLSTSKDCMNFQKNFVFGLNVNILQSIKINYDTASLLFYSLR